jgi:hypothetical protein
MNVNLLKQRLGREPDETLARRFKVSEYYVRRKRLELGIPSYKPDTHIRNGEKKCCVCKKWRPIGRFPHSERHKDKLDPRCYSCFSLSTSIHHQRNPEKVRAQAEVSKAIRHGELIRPEQCENCGRTCKPQAHHHLGYAKEHWLHVQWLCRSCHNAADRAQRQSHA